MGMSLPSLNCLLLAVVAVSAAGCDCVLLQSLSTMCEPVVDESFVGSWETVEEGCEEEARPTVMAVTHCGNGYELETLSGSRSTEWKAQVYQVGNLLIAEIRKLGPGHPTHVAAIALENETLGVRFLSSDWADDCLIANRGLFSCTVRSTPQDVIAALNESGLDAFSEPTVLFKRAINVNATH